jgi:hypothetical protein
VYASITIVNTCSQSSLAPLRDLDDDEESSERGAGRFFLILVYDRSRQRADEEAKPKSGH